MAFSNAGAQIVPVPVDDQGISVVEGKKSGKSVKCAYVTPAHQFPLGMTMSIGRRLELLTWAAETEAFIIEDDYDSEYRFGGQARARSPRIGPKWSSDLARKFQ